MARQDVKDEVLYLRAAGLDLGKKFLLACVRTPCAKRPGTWTLETERFATTGADLRRLMAWLLERRAEVVVLKATSDPAPSRSPCSTPTAPSWTRPPPTTWPSAWTICRSLSLRVLPCWPTACPPPI
ncbi:hypothetical protein [Streptomyces sp. NBC_00019]|uniref:hypothetical protein n=1 Tax=Streptomyces sp. NBC_00019 TaxID=2975623 RepID=UPI003245AC1C